MTIQNIRIDTTTQSTVFNPLSASGQWLCSTFGKRSPSEYNAKYPTLVEATQELPDLQSITLYSEYGDPAEWRDIVPFVLVMTVQGVYTMIDTYGMASKTMFQRIKDASVQVIFNVDGIHEQSGKVFLHSDWNVIKENILVLGKKARVKFYKFKHNAYQQNALQHFCNSVGAELEVVEDPLFGRRMFSVINEDGKWLYDIHYWQSSQRTLCQSMNGWNVLKTKIKKVHGTSIEHIKDIKEPPGGKALPNDKIINITAKGYVIEGSARSQVFSNALCSDWHPDCIDFYNQYNLDTVYELSRFSQQDLSAVNIYYNSIKDILNL